MKCSGNCGKEIDTSKHELVDEKPQWFGKYQGYTCIKAICCDCIQDPKKKAEYVNG